MKTTLHSLFFLMLIFAGLSVRAEATVGQKAPEFSATAADGRTYTLADLKGKWTVLEWTNRDCPFVKKHYGEGHMQALQKTYTAKGVVWLSVNSSAEGKQGHYNAEAALAHAKECGSAATAVLLDPSGVMGHSFGAKTTPHMFIINPEGMVVYAGAIDDDNTPDPTKVKGAHNHVVAALDAALAGKPIEFSRSMPYGCSVKYAVSKPQPAQNHRSDDETAKEYEGKPAPAFTLKDVEGKDVTLESLKGKNVVLFFYPMDDTPGCTREACGFRDLWSEFNKAGVVVYGVSPDDAASHQAFTKKHNFSFGLLSDPSHTMLQAYSAWGDHVIRSTVWIGTDGVVRRYWRVRDVAAHSGEVLEAVKQATKAP